MIEAMKSVLLFLITCSAFVLPPSVGFSLDRCGSCSDSPETCGPTLQPGGTCHCDIGCETYGDCCEDKPPCSEEPVSAKRMAFQCQTTSLSRECIATLDKKEAFWMVSACPEDWPIATGGKESIEANIIGNCTQGSPSLPPVSDLATGVVYRNEYCAVCNAVENIVPWRYSLQCSAELQRNILHFNNATLTQRVIEDECKACSFATPERFNLSTSGLPSPPPRPCHPHISTCSGTSDSQWSQEQHDEAAEKCIKGPYSLVKENREELLGTETLPYRNQHCAVCNGVSDRKLSCFRPDSGNRISDSPFGITGSPFGIVLVFSGDGNIFVDSRIITTTVSVTCAPGEVFDPISNQCRPSICPQGYTLSGGKCGTETNETDCPGFKALNVSDYEDLGNGSISHNGEVIQVEYYDSSGRPLICLSPNGSTEVNITIAYPAGYIALSYTAYSLSILGSGLILLTYSLFKKLRSIPGKALMNLAAAILLTDLLLLLQKPLVMHFPDTIDRWCAAVAIMVHACFLAQFSWMSIMIFEMARTLRMGQKLAPSQSANSKVKLFIVYLLIGWGTPFIVTTVTAIVHFVEVYIYGSIGGECFITHVVPLAIASIVPVAISLIFNAIVFVYTAKMLYTGWKNRRNLNSRSRVSYFRILLAILTATGITWVFGLIAILAKWAWYVFIVMSCTQGLVLAFGFLFSWKIGKLYVDMFRSCCHGRTLHLHQSRKKPKQVINVTNHQPEVNQTTAARISLPTTTFESM